MKQYLLRINLELCGQALTFVDAIEADSLIEALEECQFSWTNLKTVRLLDIQHGAAPFTAFHPIHYTS